MISISESSEYSILIADLIATLMTKDKKGEPFILKIWYNTRDLPFIFSSECAFEFLQEGIRIDSIEAIYYLWYDAIECFKVEIL